MIDLIKNIDSCLSKCVAGKHYGLCTLVLDNKGEHYPRTVGREAIAVTPNDKYKVMTYHRLLNADFEENEEHSFGRSLSRMNSQTVRLVVVVEIQLDASEGVIEKIVDGLPNEIEGEEYRYAQVGTSVTLIRDAQSVWGTEWGNAYKDKYQMRYNIYAVEYSVGYIKCEPVCQ